jgi:DNA-damage-inducible protein J
MSKTSAEKTLQAAPLIPNAETVEAMRAARRGELVTVGEPDKLLASLNADG